jgi:SAM-dependent methyltransferase
VSTLDLIMRQPLVYRLWMAPFAKKKFAPIVAHNDMHWVRRVLDVGCGPGTNAVYFSQADYLCIDLNVPSETFFWPQTRRTENL